MPPFSWVPRSLYLMLPSWERQGDDQSPLLPSGVGPDWGLALGGDLILWPFLVSWSSLQWVRSGLSRLKSQNASPKENPENCWVACLLIRLGVPPLWPSQATSLATQGAGVVSISLGPPEMFQKPVIEKPSTILRELENSGVLHQWTQRSYHCKLWALNKGITEFL